MPTQIEEALVLKEVEVLAIEKLFERDTIDPILDHIKSEILSIPTDISTPNGRKAVASLAYKIARTKSFIEDRHKELVYKEKLRLGAIDAEWKRIRETLDSLKIEVRKPLTDWEEKEENRVLQHELHISRLEDAIKIRVDATTADIEAAIARLEADEVDGDIMEEFEQRAVMAKAQSLQLLCERLQRSKQADAQRTELDRLRKEKEERDKEERERQIAERARKQAEDAAAKQVEEARAATQRAERELAEAQERAQREQERAVEAERKRIEALDRVAAYDREQREQDRQHRAKINNEVLAALVAGGIKENIGKKVIELIAKGQVPHCKINY
jgi:hypothetical protein